MISFITRLIQTDKPSAVSGWHFINEMFLSIPRILCGLILALSFGSSKFGMPWTPSESNLTLLQVSDWFVEDVSKFGGLFAKFPHLFAWLAGAAETIGGLCLAVGFMTRISGFLIMCTMCVAIFFQKWDSGLWNMLPAMSFLWVSMYSLVLGSGRLGVDYLIFNRIK